MSFDTSKLKRDFERASITYDDVAGLQRLVLHHLITPSAPLFSAQATVLDAGCGTGALLNWLQDNKPSPSGRGQGEGMDTDLKGSLPHPSPLPRGEGVYVVPLDLAFSMCEAAASKQAVPSAVNANIESLCFRENSFDLVVSSLALQWVNDMEAAFREFHRVLKPGGVLLISSFGTRTLHELKTAFSMMDEHVHVSPFLTMEDYAAFARAAGFTVATGESRMHLQQVTQFADLMRQLKSLGAGNKWKHRRRGLTTHRQLAQVEEHYKSRFAAREQLPVTWEIIHMKCRK